MISQELQTGLMIIASIATILWVLWVTTKVGDIGGISRGLQRSRETFWQERDKTQDEIAKLKQRIKKFEQRANVQYTNSK